jgi:small GTP-binding protein
LFFWDIAGQREFDFMRPTFYKGSKAAIIVFSHTDAESFNKIPEWHEDIKSHVGDLPIVLFGNKIDLVEDDGRDDEKIQEIVKQREFLDYFKTSAKTGSGVYEAFQAIIKNLYNKYKEA